MRILGVSVLGLVELAACWQQREGARRAVNGKAATPFEHRPWLRSVPRAALDEGGESAAPADERRWEHR